MKKQKRTKPKPKKSRRRLLMICIASVLVAVAGTTVISRQLASRLEDKAVAEAVRAKYRTVRVAGQDIQVDAQTGQLRPLSPQDAQRLAEGLKRLVNRSTEGLVEVHHPDGSVSVDLDGRFQNVTVARLNEDGTLTQSCIDSPEAAASFFGIDPKLMGVEAAPSRQVPLRKVLQ